MNAPVEDRVVDKARDGKKPTCPSKGDKPILARQSLICGVGFAMIPESMRSGLMFLSGDTRCIIEQNGDSAMLKAELRKGVIVPLEPLPPEWEEGAALEVAKVDAPQVDIDAWAKSMNALCADSLVEDEEAMRRAIAEHQREAKAQMRRDMGLSA